MTPAKPGVVKDELTTHDRTQAAIEAYRAKSDERTSPGPNPVRERRYLDVDGVLARSSLPEALRL
jgi:hypothetical protein